MRHYASLVSTVGTSLKGNMKNISAEAEAAYAAGNLIPVLQAMKGLPEDARALGAEINTIADMAARGHLSWPPARLAFLVSDTPDGERIGSLLEGYYRSRHGIEDCLVLKCGGLKDDDVAAFRTTGLRNLVRNLAGFVRERPVGEVAINATGGYKAQILYAGVLGQAMKVPVFYKHEAFNMIMELPPLPVAFDMGFWLSRIDDFLQLDSAGEVPAAEVAALAESPEAATLLEEVTVEGTAWAALTPIGQVFHESFLYQYHATRTNLLPPESGLAPGDKKLVEEGGAPGDRPPGFRDCIARIFRQPWVTGARTFYYNPDLPGRNSLRIGSKCAQNEIEGIFSDGKATTKYILNTTARNNNERAAVLIELAALLG